MATLPSIEVPETTATDAGTVMRLRVILPEEVLIDTSATRIVAEGFDGAFGILPRHIDFVSALATGVIEYTGTSGDVRYIGSDEGILVKLGHDVLISVRGAVIGEQLGELRSLVEDRFVHLDVRERTARSALARLEAEVARRFIKLRLQHEPF